MDKEQYKVQGYVDTLVESERKTVYKGSTAEEDDIKRDLREVYSKDERDHLRWYGCDIKDKQHLLDAYDISLSKLDHILATMEKKENIGRSTAKRAELAK